MSYEENLVSLSLNADSSLAEYTGTPGAPGSPAPHYAKQYRFVKVTGGNQVGLATAPEDAVVGVLQNKPQVAGQAATVGLSGVSNVMAGEALAAGDKVTCGSDGRAVKATGASFCGIALLPAEDENTLAPVMLGTGLF